VSRPDTHAAEKRDLHARITAAIDRVETATTYDRNMGWHKPYVEFVLRGLAEDRDILRRHEPDRIPADRPQDWDCRGCEVHMGNLSCDYGEHEHTVPWPCPEVLSVARRHGIEAS